MLRIISVLLIAATCSPCFGQDTLAVVDSPYSIKDAFVFLQGDSTFIGFVHASATTGVLESEYVWFHKKQKIAEVDLKNVGKETLLGVQKYNDTIYYYGYSNKGKGATIVSFRSVDFGTPTVIAETDVDGNIMGGYSRAGVVTVVTLDRKANKVHAVDMKRGIWVKKNELPFPWDIHQIEPRDVTFITPDHFDKIQLAEDAFKIFLQDNTLGIVFDDTYHNLVDPKDFRRTLVLRKDLVTGKQEADGFRINERKDFISYLDGKFLYRVLPSGDDWRLVVQDLDSNEAIYTLEFAHVNVDYFYRRSTTPQFFEKFNYLVDRSDDKDIWRKYRNNVDRLKGYPIDIAIDVKSFEGQKSVTVGFVNDLKVDLPKVFPGLTLAKRLVVGNPDAFLLAYIYLAGSPQTKFEPAPPELKFGMRLADDYELDRSESPGSVEYTSTKNNLIGIYAPEKSHRYTFVRFPTKP